MRRRFIDYFKGECQRGRNLLDLSLVTEVLGIPFFLFLSFSLSNHIADPALADTFVTFSIMLANTIQPDLVFL